MINELQQVQMENGAGRLLIPTPGQSVTSTVPGVNATVTTIWTRYEWL
jgi:hypothetical protein